MADYSYSPSGTTPQDQKSIVLGFGNKVSNPKFGLLSYKDNVCQVDEDPECWPMYPIFESGNPLNENDKPVILGVTRNLGGVDTDAVKTNGGFSAKSMCPTPYYHPRIECWDYCTGEPTYADSGASEYWPADAQGNVPGCGDELSKKFKWAVPSKLTTNTGGKDVVRCEYNAKTSMPYPDPSGLCEGKGSIAPGTLEGGDK